MWTVAGRMRAWWYDQPARRRDLFADCLALLVWGLLFAGEGGADHLAWALSAAALLALRRRFPLPVLLAVGALHVACSLPLAEQFHPVAAGAMICAAYTAGRFGPLLPSGLGLLAIGAALALGTGGDLDLDGWLSWTALVLALPSLFGLYVRRSRRLILVLRQEQRLAAQRAVLEDRTRIAREVHDLLGNKLSLIVLNAGAIELAGGEAAERAGVIRQSGCAALHDLRRVIGVLDGEPAQPEDAGSCLEALLRCSVQAGLPLTVELDWQPDELPPAVSALVHQLVREALTNVHKHAGAVPTAVTVRSDSTVLTVLVANEVPTSLPDTHALGSGSGLSTVAERLRLLGGVLVHGSTSDGYQVRARIPLGGRP
ncbi:hypothetical protein KALB_2296 [Kutzneria albida DSM 43870]|uniref:histidine kinase n=2 Tax=Kutzneria TaxID=43356 RepID=W5W4H7_9PSEU|nr:hypothetical protein KALB_2296 [Kutzneria albida DSM 43870]